MKRILAALLALSLLAAPALASDISQSAWSETDASNNSAAPAGFAEGMAPSSVNDSARAVMGALKRFWKHINGVVVAGGTGDAITLTYDVAPAALADGETYSFETSAANTGTATLNINALGAKTIKKISASGYANLAANDFLSGQRVIVQYDLGSDTFRLVSPIANPVPDATKLPLAGGTMTGAIDEIAGSNIASAGTTNLCTATGNFAQITGTTTITGFGTCQAGVRRIVYFAGALTLTHNATSLILPGAANITTAANDRLEAVSLGSGNWIVVDYTKASGAAVVGTTSDNYARLVQTVASGNNGGTSTATTWTKRTLTEDVDADGIVSVAASVFTLGAGTYDLEFAGVFGGCGSGSPIGAMRVRDTTNGATLIRSTSGGGISTGEDTPVVGAGRFTLSGSTNLELQYYVTAGCANVGLGHAITSGENEIFAWVEIRKVNH